LQIPSYQIHNVLKQHIAQLAGKLKRIDDTLDWRLPYGVEGHFFAAKRQEVIKTVTKKNLKRVVDLVLDAHGDHTDKVRPEDGSSSPDSAGNDRATTFIFNVIDKNNRKVAKKISVEKPAFVLKVFVKQLSDVSQKKSA
jgi:hypothetical protein